MIHWLDEQKKKRVQSDPESVIQGFGDDLSGLSPDELFELAVAYDLMGQNSRVKSLCRTALQKGFGHIPSLYALALKSFENSRFDEGKRWFSRAIHFDADASENALYLQHRLRSLLSTLEATRWGLWCLQQLHQLDKSSDSSQFELGKLHFEASNFEMAAETMRPLVGLPQYSFESTQYLSYIYERIYSGDVLIEKTLELASAVIEKSDLFFNLAMVCQHDQKRVELSLHFFYLACRSDRQDPGLRFSLEQACLEYIGSVPKPRSAEQHFNLMIAHLYHGSIAVAERYARVLRDRFDWRYPDNFEGAQPQSLWREWLLKDQGLLGDALSQWFSDAPVMDWKLKRTQPDPRP